MNSNPQPEPAEPKWDATNPDESFSRYAEFLHAKAKWMFQKDKTHVEIVFVFKPSGEGTLLLTQGDRDVFMANIKELIQENDAVGIVHVAEAWIRSGAKDHIMKQLMLGEIAVSDLRPKDRMEALFTSVQSVGQSSCWVDPIIRDEKTGEVSLGEGCKLENISGRFGRLFNEA